MRVEKSLVINRPLETVFAFVTNMHNVKRWLPINDIRPLSDGPIRIGSTFMQSANFMGQHFEATIEVTIYQPPHAFAFKTIQGPFPLRNSMMFAAVDGGTQVTLVGEAEPGKTLKIAGPLLMPLVKKQLDTQVNTLKRVIEAEV